ncbi:MAG TPA: V-type ATPase 116kDa subunit family protein [Candidatus Brocadiia bacterium]|nr:V-type ATPase 116kDa subunit family protein [Candidatus Brocadiia bacterium]
MFRPTRMTKLDMLVLQRDAETVTRTLGNLGAIHFTRANEHPEALPLGDVEHDEMRRSVLELQARCDALCEELGVAPEYNEETSIVYLEAVQTGLADIERESASVTMKYRDFKQRRAHLEKLLDEVMPYKDMEIPLERLNSFSFLHFALGTIERAKNAIFRSECPKGTVVFELPAAPSQEPDRIHIMAACARSSRWALQTALENASFEADNIIERQKGLGSEIYGSCDKELVEVRAAMAGIEAQRSALAQRFGDQLVSYRKTLNHQIQILDAHKNYGSTGSTYLISGWVPTDKVDGIMAEIQKLVGNRTVVELRAPKPGDEEAPVHLKNHPLVRPFELLVSGYSTPSYNEVEPTILVAISFLLMYGIMFADMGHGMLLALIGLAVNKKMKPQASRDLGYIMGCAGVSGFLFGILEGKFLGWKMWEPLLIHPEEQVMLFMGVVVGLGALMISAGLILNIINRFLIRDYEKAFLDKAGIVGALFYWGALALAARTIAGVVIQTWHVVLLAIPLVLLFFKEPIIAILKKKKHLFHEGFMMTIMMEIIELLEILSGYLANTISFARIMGFALSHSFLCLVVVDIIGMVLKLPAGPVLAVIVGIIGHGIIIGLEGLVVGIQCMRLQYYEFFSRFFRGGGTAYRPFRLG